MRVLSLRHFEYGSIDRFGFASESQLLESVAYGDHFPEELQRVQPNLVSINSKITLS